MEQGGEGIDMNASDFNGMVKELEDRINEDEKRRFSKKVLKEAREPQNMGKIEDPDSHASITGPCGDTMEFYMTVEEDRITNIRFMTDGCGSSIACGSITTKMAMGKNLEEASGICGRDILEELGGLPETNRHCAELAAETLFKAIHEYLRREE
jgi:nitrogen fixation NifU-like protein